MTTPAWYIVAADDASAELALVRLFAAQKASVADVGCDTNDRAVCLLQRS